ncbi:hypothetical protein BH23CHL5_BH23CHL5_23890 [soil metagenome]
MFAHFNPIEVVSFTVNGLMPDLVLMERVVDVDALNAIGLHWWLRVFSEVG